MTKIGEKEFLRAYRGWVFAGTNAIAERIADIELKIQKKNSNGWTQVEEHEALDLVHSVSDLIFGTATYLELTGTGMGTLEASAIAVDIHNYAGEWQRKFFDNSAMPRGVLSTNGTTSILELPLKN